MDTPRQILVFGKSDFLWRLAVCLRASPWLRVVEQHTFEAVSLQDEDPSKVIVVDAAQITPEQFGRLIEIHTLPNRLILSIDPVTCQLTIHSYPNPASPLAEAARMIEILSYATDTDESY
ncbi:MAG: hypothetical protein ABFD44_05335 [Anaerolineaceae bacterium]